MPVPHRFRVHDNGRAMLTLVEAAGLVGANFATDAGFGQHPLEFPLKIACSSRIATAAGVPCRALIAADEDVFGEFWHE